MKRQSALRLPRQDQSNGEATQGTDSICLTSVEGTRAHLRVRILFLLVIALLLGSASALRAATVTATWNANPESDIAGYKLSYGTQTGVYTTTVDVGNVTSRALTLTNGQRYYFAVQAYNTSAMTSAYSAEVFFDVPASTADHHEPGPAERADRHVGDDHRHELRRDPGDEHASPSTAPSPRRRRGRPRVSSCPCRPERPPGTSSSPSGASPATAWRSPLQDRHRASRAGPRRAGRSARR